MAVKEFISQQARKRFETPPQLTDLERSSLIIVPVWANATLDLIISPTNKIGFILQIGYFRLMGRFFHPKTYVSCDIDFILKAFGGDPNEVDLSEYKSSTYHRHREVILRGFGFVAYGSDQERQTDLIQEILRMARNQTSPAQIFDNIVAYLWDHRIEIPTYYTLKMLIGETLKKLETELNEVLNKFLRPSDYALLDSLFEKSPLTESFAPKSIRYKLTFFKSIPQSMQNREITIRVEMFAQLKVIYLQLLPVIKRLNLSDATIRYYAEYVIDTQTTQLKNNLSQRNLWLIAFIIHQYFSLGDALVLTFKKAVRMAMHSSENRQQEKYWKQKPVRTRLTSSISARGITYAEMLAEIEKISNDGLLTAEVKILHIQHLYQQKRISGKGLAVDIDRFKELQILNQTHQDNQDYYQELEKISFRLQLKLSNILLHAHFSMQSTQHPLLKAIAYFQDSQGNISQKKDLPVDFLGMDERQKVYTDQGKLKVSLYKILLFKEINQNIKSGTLYVENSYQYRPYTHFLIPIEQWQRHRNTYIQKAGISDYENGAMALLRVNHALNRQFEIANINLAGNPFLSVDVHGKWLFHKPKEEEFMQEEKARLTKLLYPADRSISILEVFFQLHRLTGFISFFEHHSPLMEPKRPADRLFYAAIIGYGENIGISAMATISKNIGRNSLENVATHYFSPETLMEVNGYLVELTNQLPLEDHFRRHSGFVHTSSDGMKVNVTGPCLRASESYKYFGNGKGVIIYSHLDEGGQLNFSTVFSADEPESAYLLDGLTYHELFQPDAHSTDDHGHSLPVYAISSIIGVDLRSRIANLKQKTLFSIDMVSNYKEKGYKILPHERVNYENIITHWDNILRVVCSIKLGHAKASDLFRQLNSYDRQNPLYKALSDLGKLFRTIYILRYVDDPEIRASVEAVLANGEHSNVFSRAVMGNEPYRWLTQREQLIAEGCKRLMMNAINYYNHLLMLKMLAQCKTAEERQEKLKLIVQTNTHTWSHINLKGTYDFTEHENFMSFDLDLLSKLDLRA